MPAIPLADDNRRPERERRSQRRGTGRRDSGRSRGKAGRREPYDEETPSGAPAGPGMLGLPGVCDGPSGTPGPQDSREPGEEPPAPPAAKVRRLLSLAIAGFTVLATVALVFGANTSRPSDAVVVFGMQLLFVVVWTVASRPPAPRIVIAVGVAAAIGADVASVVTSTATLEPLAYVTAAGFVAGVVGQLLRPAGRIRVTESLGSSLVIVVGAVSLAALIELTRHPRGTQALVASMTAAGAAVAIARLADVILPVPRIAPQVPRGGVGVVLGTMVGTGVAAAGGFYLHGLDVTKAALAGLVSALVAAMVDLSVGYAEAGRSVEGDAPALWLSRHMQGPLGALAFASPAAYAASLLLLNVS